MHFGKHTISDLLSKLIPEKSIIQIKVFLNIFIRSGSTVMKKVVEVEQDEVKVSDYFRVRWL